MDVSAPRAQQPIYLIEIMKRLGIDPVGDAISQLGQGYAVAFDNCEACPSKQACRDWLATMPQPAAGAPRFCPNAAILSELQAGRRDRAKSRAHIADLERLEDEIEEILLRKATDDSMVADLKRRRLYLRNEIESLQLEAGAASRPH